MPNLKLSNKTKSVRNKGIPGIIKDNLVLSHDYQTKSVIPVSDGAAYFNSSNTDYILLSDTMQSTFRGDWSVSMWIKPLNAASSSLQALMGSKNSSTEDWWYVAIDDGDLVAYYKANNDADNARSDGQVLSSGVEGWHHVAFTVKKFTATTGWLLYLDGAEVRRDSTLGTTAENWELFTTDIPPMIGGQNNDDSVNNVFDGYIANVAVYGEQLTQAKVNSIMNKNYDGLTTSDKTNLVSWWNLDDTVDTVADGLTHVYDSHYGGTGAELGAELFSNPNFDDTSAWVDKNIDESDTVALSTEQVRNGQYSLYVNVNISGEGTGQGITTTADKLYEVSGWFYVVSGVAKINPNDGHFTAGTELRTTTTGEWEYISGYLKASGTGGSKDIYIQSSGGAAEFYIDNVSIKEVQGNTGELK